MDEPGPMPVVRMSSRESMRASGQRRHRRSLFETFDDLASAGLDETLAIVRDRTPRESSAAILDMRCTIYTQESLSDPRYPSYDSADTAELELIDIPDSRPASTHASRRPSVVFDDIAESPEETTAHTSAPPHQRSSRRRFKRRDSINELICEEKHGEQVVLAGSVASLVEYLLKLVVMSETPSATKTTPFFARQRSKNKQSVVHEEFCKTFFFVYRLFLTPQDVLDSIRKAIEAGTMEQNTEQVMVALTLLELWIQQVPLDFTDSATLGLNALTMLTNLGDMSLAPQLLDTASRICGQLAHLDASSPQDPIPPCTTCHSIICASPKSIAHQLTLINSGLFQRVHVSDLVYRTFVGTNSAALQLLVSQFDAEYYWTISEIESTADVGLQQLLISKFLQIAWECFHLHNFQSMFTLTMGLQATNTRQHQASWSSLPEKHQATYAKLCELTSHDHNLKAYRTALSKVPHKLGKLPLLPIVTKDMRYIADAALSSAPHLVNFHRLRQVSNYARDVMGGCVRPMVRLDEEADLQVFLRTRFQQVLLRRGTSMTDSPPSVKTDMDAMTVKVTHQAEQLADLRQQVTALKLDNEDLRGKLERQRSFSKQLIAVRPNRTFLLRCLDDQDKVPDHHRMTLEQLLEQDPARFTLV